VHPTSERLVSRTTAGRSPCTGHVRDPSVPRTRVGTCRSSGSPRTAPGRRRVNHVNQKSASQEGGQPEWGQDGERDVTKRSQCREPCWELILSPSPPGSVRVGGQRRSGIRGPFFFWVGLGFELRAFTLSHSSSPFYEGFFPDRVSQTICPGWLQTAIFLISAF
jgi:hypothetical protein